MPLQPILRPFAAALILTLAGCATSPPTAPTAPVAAYRDTIELNGKIGVDYQTNGAPERLNGSFTWTQRPARVDIVISNPLGQTVAEISVTPESATLVQAKREPRTARDIDTLTQQTLGWPLPVAGLRDWLQGYAVDAQGKRFAASPTNNQVVTRDGWRLRFVDWQQGKATPSPRLIKAERGASGGELAITISILPES